MTQEQEEPDSAFEATQYFFEDIAPETSIGEDYFIFLGLDLFCFPLRNYTGDMLVNIMPTTWSGSHDICTSETSAVVVLDHMMLTSCDFSGESVVGLTLKPQL